MTTLVGKKGINAEAKKARSKLTDSSPQPLQSTEGCTPHTTSPASAAISPSATTLPPVVATSPAAAAAKTSGPPPIPSTNRSNGRLTPAGSSSVTTPQRRLSPIPGARSTPIPSSATAAPPPNVNWPNLLEALTQVRRLLEERVKAVTDALGPSESVSGGDDDSDIVTHLTAEERTAAKSLCATLCNKVLSSEDVMAAALNVLGAEDVYGTETKRGSHSRPTVPAATAAGGGGPNPTAEDSQRRSRIEEAGVNENHSDPQFLQNLQHSQATCDVDMASKDALLAQVRMGLYASSMVKLFKAWMIITRTNMEAFSMEVFDHLISGNPAYRYAFTESTTRESAINLMHRISKAVVSLSQPAEMLNVIIEVGARHCLFEVKDEHYQAIRDSFMTIYPRYVPATVYASTVDLWHSFWNTIISLLSIGSASAIGLRYAEQRRTLWARHVTKVFGEIANRQRGTLSEARTHPFIHSVFIRAILANPAMEVHSAFLAPRVCDRAMESLIKTANSLHDTSEAEALIAEEVNTGTTALGLPPDVLAECRKPFMDSCEHYIGKDEALWTRQNIMALEQFWSFIISSSTKAHGTAIAVDPAVAHAPDGNEPFCLMFTDIEASTKLWERNRTVMAEAVKCHHSIVRGLINDYGGYEVKTVGDSFMIACKSPLIALQIALGIQLELMKYPTATGFRMTPNPRGGGDATCWREDSVRVRVGIHYCTEASANYDSVAKRYDYYGPSVNCTARVEALACGGQILMTKECMDELQKCKTFTEEPRPRGLCGFTEAHRKAEGNNYKPLSQYVEFIELGPHELKGIAEPVNIVSAMPIRLVGRSFDMGSQYTGMSMRTDVQDKQFIGMPIDRLSSAVFGSSTGSKP